VRIGLITQWYDPEVGAAAIYGSVARTLAQRGHEVRVLTGFPNYPSGRIYAGYRRRPYQREMREGVAVHRAPLLISHDKRPLHRSANYLSFAGSSTAIGGATFGGVEVSLVSSSPMTVAIPAMALRATRRIPYVLWVQDMWPQTVTASGFLDGRIAAVVEQGLHRFCDVVYRGAARIAVTSPGMAGLIADRGIPSSKISFVPNWADEARFHPSARTLQAAAEFGPFRPFTVMYAGSLGDIQGLHTVIAAADMLRTREDIGFVFVGSGVAEHSLRAEVAARHLDNVRFLGIQPLDRMSEILALGDVQLVALRDLPIFRCTLPSKVQATLAAGRPVVGVVAGDAATVIDAAGGLTVPPGAPADLAAAVDRMSRMDKSNLLRLGERGRLYYEEHLGRSAGGARLEDLLQAVRDEG